MSNDKHTPGPWIVSGRHNRWGDNLVVPAGSDVSADGYLACVRVTGDGHGPADARLIAAAPELLAALEEILEFYLASCPGVSGQPIDDARAAIARAKGEAK